MRRARTAAALALILVAAAAFEGSASAQSIKARVLVLVDTSGSMLEHFGDDTSTGGDSDLTATYFDGVLAAASMPPQQLYPGLVAGGMRDGMNSRIYGAKQAVLDLVNATNDIDFGLMRYILDPTCPDPVQNCCTFAAPQCKNGTNPILKYSDGNVNYKGSCGVLDMNGAVIDGGQILVFPGAPKDAFGKTGNQEVLSWVDQVEDFEDRGDGWPKNPELRALGPTPLAGTVRTALNKWYGPIYDVSKSTSPSYNPADPSFDPQFDCRPYAFVMMTDGGEECETTGGGKTPDADAVTLLTGKNPQNPVKTYVLGMATDVVNIPSLSSLLNGMAAAGGTGAARLVSSQSAIQASLADIAASAVKVEVCNNVDDNCNGQVDEGFTKGGTCTVGFGICVKSGVTKCDPSDSSRTTCCVDDGNVACVPLMPGPKGVETCPNNNKDDDCDGVIDIPCAPCTPTSEVCDGKDNDCDGVIDNMTGVNALIDIGRACGLSLGICTPGMTACVPDMGKTFPDVSDHLECTGGVQPAATDDCNGFDDNCDGIVDGVSQACYDGPMGTEGNGPCIAGKQACIAVKNSGVATFGPCVGEVLPKTELCNGIDDDCNMMVDDVAGAGTACCPSGKCGVGVCVAGTQQCSGGRLDCSGGTGPSGELCDGLDNDCNGATDDLPNVGKPCLPNGASCGTGTLQCDVPSMQVVCKVASAGGMGELCNGLDDNCDGNIDELNGPGGVLANDPRVNVACGDTAMLPLPCKAGTTICQSGKVICDGEVKPAAGEICNGVDDNCDGIVDNGAPCTTATDCVSGECRSRCNPGDEFPDCPDTFQCAPDKVAADGGATDTDGGIVGVTGHCVPAVTCNPACACGDTACVGGTCLDNPCDAADAPVCLPGYQHDCKSTGGRTCQCVDVDACDVKPSRCNGCVNGAGGERCIKDDNGFFACAPDLCCGNTCGANAICNPTNGQCVCTNCPVGQLCSADGAGCIDDPCEKPAKVKCTVGDTCDTATGACVSNPCFGVAQCVTGQVCCASTDRKSSHCAADSCATLGCPSDSICVVSPLTCEPACVPPTTTPDNEGLYGGGGLFGCATGGRPAGDGGTLFGALGALLLLGLARRRRS